MRKKLMDENITTQNSTISDTPDSTPIKPYSIKYADKDNRIPKIIGGKITRRNKMKKKECKEKVCEKKLEIQPIETALFKNSKGVKFDKIISLQNLEPKSSFRDIIQDVYYYTSRKGDVDVNLRGKKNSLMNFLEDHVGEDLHVGSYKDGNVYKIMASDDSGNITKFDGK